VSRNFFGQLQELMAQGTARSSAGRQSGWTGERQQLQDHEVEDFMIQAEVRSDRPPGKPNADLIRYLKLKNRWRWRRLCKDFKWAQSVAAKGKFNPEEVRWLL
jgi:hypothetical protein